MIWLVDLQDCHNAHRCPQVPYKILSSLAVAALTSNRLPQNQISPPHETKHIAMTNLHGRRDICCNIAFTTSVTPYPLFLLWCTQGPQASYPDF